ncbi:RNase P/RNase MRP complex subunit [Sporothrix eucalyptigena]|uniref:Ribonuclease P protein subunit n=1 Tax=Sporothrix eucalyptigena TaxID=1812306 RepID=A0ABP0BAE1_9PEZI
MATPARGLVHKLLERAHSPDTAAQIFTDKIQHREQFLRPTSPGREEREGASTTAAASLAAAAAANAAAELAAAGASGHNGREARRRSRRIKQEQRQHRARALKPKPLSSRQRRALEKAEGTADEKKNVSYATFVPLHRLWLGYIREVLGPNELRTGGSGAAAKLTAADFHGALVEVTRSACVGRVGTRGIVIRDTRFVFEVVTPKNEVKMVPKEGTFFRIEIPLDDDDDKEDNKKDESAESHDIAAEKTPAPSADTPKMVIEILGSQFMFRAADRGNRKFKQHFYKEL